MSVRFPIPPDHFGGGANLTPEGAADLADLLNQLAIEKVHEFMVAPGGSDGPPGQNPQIAVKGALSYLEFTLDIDAAHRIWKIPAGFVVDSASLHVHWTKSTDADESGKDVKWRVTYNVFDGKTEDGSDGTVTTFDLDATYLDSGLGSRIVYRTEDVDLVGLVPAHYLSAKIEAITPAGTPLPTPALIALDLIYTMQRGTI